MDMKTVYNIAYDFNWGGRSFWEKIFSLWFLRKKIIALSVKHHIITVILQKIFCLHFIGKKIISSTDKDLPHPWLSMSHCLNLSSYQSRQSQSCRTTLPYMLAKILRILISSFNWVTYIFVQLPKKQVCISRSTLIIIT